MNTRQCGYCRAVGHNKSNCEYRLNIIDTIRRHVGAERTALSYALLKHGYGVGAIVTGYSYLHGGMINCLVTQESLDKLFEYETNVVEYRNIKYTKKVRVSLYHKLTPCVSTLHEDIFTYIRGNVQMPVTPLEMGGENAVATIMIDDLGSVNPCRRDYWSMPSQVLSPSSDGEFSMESMNKKFRLHERLTDKMHVTPIF